MQLSHQVIISMKYPVPNAESSICLSIWEVQHTSRRCQAISESPEKPSTAFPQRPKGPKGKRWLLLVVLFGFKPLSLRCLTAYSHRFHGTRWASVKRADDDTMVHVLLTVVLCISPGHGPVCLGLSKAQVLRLSRVL